MHKAKHKPVPLIKDYFGLYDDGAEAWEVFMGEDCDVYVGCADTLAEARKVAEWHREDGS